MSSEARSTATPPTASPSTAPSAASNRGVRGYACVTCSRRKVRCDRLEPCTNCRRGGTECLYLQPKPRRRTSKLLNDGAALERLRRLEDLLQGMGVDPDGTAGRQSSSNPPPEPRNALDSRQSKPTPPLPVAQPSPKPPASMYTQKGRLIKDDSTGTSRYVETNPLWTNLNDEVDGDKQMLHDSEDEDQQPAAFSMPCSTHESPGFLLFGGYDSAATFDARKGLRELHPNPDQVRRLWKYFLANVNPLTKMVHAPSRGKSIEEVLTGAKQLKSRMEAFLFSMYFITVWSMTQQECKSLLGLDRDVSIAKYQVATQRALVGTGLLKTADLTVLQAFTLFLFGIRNRVDPGTLWALAGVCVRIAQRIGLHRDGTFLNLPPFETEMRRRIWWQVIMLDLRMADLAGALGSLTTNDWDTKLPLNLDDCDLDPQMKHFPPESERGTDMMHVLIRYIVFSEVRGHHNLIGNDSSTKIHWKALTPDKQAALRKIEENLQRRFLQYCDPLNPLHTLCSIVCQIMIARFKMTVAYPRPQSGDGSLEGLSKQERDQLFFSNVRSLEYDALVYRDPRLRGYLWHVENHFQWRALVVLLEELKTRFSGDDVDKAWSCIQEAYDNHPDFVSDMRKTLHLAVGNLIIKVWDTREAALRKTPDANWLQTPDCVAKLRAVRAHLHATKNRQADGNHSSVTPDAHYNRHDTQYLDLGFANHGCDNFSSMAQPWDPANPISLGFTPMDWGQWDSLISNDMQTNNNTSLF